MNFKKMISLLLTVISLAISGLAYAHPAIIVDNSSALMSKDTYDEDSIYCNVSDITLKRKATKTLKALDWNGKKLTKVTWRSANKKIATVSSGGKVKAIAAGRTWIIIEKKGLQPCYVMVSVKPGAKDPALLSGKDAYIKYGGVKVKRATTEARVKRILPKPQRHVDYSNNICLYYGSTSYKKAHTILSFEAFTSPTTALNSVLARAKSPVKTSRGIGVGATLKKVQAAYGKPSQIIKSYKASDGKKYTLYVYNYERYTGEVPDIGCECFYFNSKSKVAMMEIIWYDLGIPMM